MFHQKKQSPGSFLEKVFLKISENSQENTGVRVSLKESRRLRLVTY